LLAELAENKKRQSLLLEVHQGSTPTMQLACAAHNMHKIIQWTFITAAATAERHPALLD
jgi:hypothetical protein